MKYQINEKVPTQLHSTMKAVLAFNSAIAKWNRNKYVGRPPNDLVASIVDLHQGAIEFLSTYKGG